MKKLVCIGGGENGRIKNGVRRPYETKEIDEEIVKLSGKKNPKLLFISIASHYSETYFPAIKEVFEKLGCIASHLDVSKPYEELKNDILNTDIIYIGGGNTEYLMEELKEKRIGELLIQAYEKGVVCSGISAGSYCWFKYYRSKEGLGLINAVNCVHYDQVDNEEKEIFYNQVKEKILLVMH